MNLEIALMLGIIALVLTAFLREWASPDVLAMTTLCLLLGLGLIPMDAMVVVFSNEAPLAIAALFIIGAALESSGAVTLMGIHLKRRLRCGLRGSILAISLLTAFASAWMNNTAIVAILLPVLLGLARSRDMPASQLLMPLSYASILGGGCTLIGTSTNLLANGVLINLGQEPLTMFELSRVGIPVALAGIAYLALAGPRLIPDRRAPSDLAPIANTEVMLYHLIVRPESALVGRQWQKSRFARMPDMHVIEVRRDGKQHTSALSELTIECFDRFLVAMPKRDPNEVEALARSLGMDVLSRVPGRITELVIKADSHLKGDTLNSCDFRQRYLAVVLAVHRNGQALPNQPGMVTLEAGDMLLTLTPEFNLDALMTNPDFLVADEHMGGTPLRHKHALLSVGVLIAAIAATTISDTLHRHIPSIPTIPIYFSAIVAALILLWSRTLTPRQAHQAINWQIIFMLYGLLGLGLAMQHTGTTIFLAHGLVDLASQLVSADLLPLVLLWCLFLGTLLLTEVLSNNATAVMMLPLVIPMAEQMDVSARPYAIAVILAASYAFALPMGYQTHLMVYGPGGFRFRDFLRVGLPLNIICWVTACLVIPLFWPF